MATNVIMPALGMAQATGRLVSWLKAEGQAVTKGEPLMEVETDKATVEIEAPATGRLAGVTAAPGDEVPVGQAIAVILAPGEALPADEPSPAVGSATAQNDSLPAQTAPARPDQTGLASVSPVAARIAAEHDLDVRLVKPQGGRIEKADVLAYLESRSGTVRASSKPRLTPASPKARRLAAERGIDLAAIVGTGPGGAVLAADVLDDEEAPAKVAAAAATSVSTVWRIMAERTTRSWTTVPHFFLLREVNATRLVTWREKIQKRFSEKITYTDLLVKLVAAALREHPRLNARWDGGAIALNDEINVGLAVAVGDGLLVPVVRRADELDLGEIAARRQELIARARAGKSRLEDLQDGTFTISNLGMYGVDAFNAIINPPQAAILAVGRIAERAVSVNGRVRGQPTMILSLSCDHRVVDGVRGAQFLETLADLLEEPLGLLH